MFTAGVSNDKSLRMRFTFARIDCLGFFCSRSGNLDEERSSSLCVAGGEAAAGCVGGSPRDPSWRRRRNLRGQVKGGLKKERMLCHLFELTLRVGSLFLMMFFRLVIRL
jgi:hypothetical protein